MLALAESEASRRTEVALMLGAGTNDGVHDEPNIATNAVGRGHALQAPRAALATYAVMSRRSATALATFDIAARSFPREASVPDRVSVKVTRASGTPAGEGDAEDDAPLDSEGVAVPDLVPEEDAAVPLLPPVKDGVSGTALAFGAVGERVADDVDAIDNEGVSVADDDGLEVAEGLALTDGLAVGDSEGVAEPEGVIDGDAPNDSEPVGVAVPLAVADGVGVGVGELVLDAVADGVDVGVTGCDGETEDDAEAAGVRVGVEESVGAGTREDVHELVGDTVPELVGVGKADAEGNASWVGVGVCDAKGPTDPNGLGVCEADVGGNNPPEGVGVIEIANNGVGVAEAPMIRDGASDAERVGVRVRVGVGEGVSTGDEGGSVPFDEHDTSVGEKPKVVLQPAGWVRATEGDDAPHVGESGHSRASTPPPAAHE